VSAGFVLRVRSGADDDFLQSVKSAGALSHGPFRRQKIDVAARTLAPDLSLFDPKTASELDDLVGGKTLLPQFKTRVKRMTVMQKYESCLIEVAFDYEAILVEGANVPISEVKIELKNDGEAKFYDYALKFMKDLFLRLNFANKSERGFRALSKQQSPVVSSEPLVLAATATLDEVVNEALGSTPAHFTGNWAAMRETAAPGAVHQMGIILRRMRTALGMFRRVLSCPEFGELAAEAKRIVDALGPARECDVFRENATIGPFADAECLTGHTAVLAVLVQHHGIAYELARSIIGDPATTAFVPKVQSFLARKGWSASALKAPARRFALTSLTRLHAKVLKRGAAIGQISDEGCNKLRITLKNPRYASEFFGAVFKRRCKLRAFLQRI
jgi:triphosphatase